MDANFRITLLALGGLILLAIVVDAFRSHWRHRNALKATKSPRSTRQAAPVFKEGLVMLSIHAPEGHSFGDYGFLQVLGANGLRFGERNIFHYDHQGQVLFSVAKLNEPGTFDVDDVESLTCDGLLIFMETKSLVDPVGALNALLNVTFQLAEDLEAKVCVGYNYEWQEDSENALLEHVKASAATPVS